jgi:FkbM family methyltransferase
VVLLISASFILETYFRLVYISALFRLKEGSGLFVSFLRYYRFPFRWRRAERMYGQFLEPGDLVFDAGAHLGGRIAVFHRLGCRVVAFEPQNTCHGLLQAWYGDREDIRILPLALGSEEGSLPLHTVQGNPTLASLAPEWIDKLRGSKEFEGIRWDEGERIPVSTLDRSIERWGTPRFIKIDVEGLESAVLSGLSLLIEALSFEFIGADKEGAIKCLAALAALGAYEFNFAPGESFRLAFAQWQSSARIEDFISTRSSKLPSGDIYARLVHAR